MYGRDEIETYSPGAVVWGQAFARLRLRRILVSTAPTGNQRCVLGAATAAILRSVLSHDADHLSAGTRRVCELMVCRNHEIEAYWGRMSSGAVRATAEGRLRGKGIKEEGWPRRGRSVSTARSGGGAEPDEEDPVENEESGRGEIELRCLSLIAVPAAMAA